MLAICFALTAALSPLAEDPPKDPGIIRVDTAPVHMNPEDPSQSTVGRLTYLGGVELHSQDSRFGGFSALELERADPDALSGGLISDSGMAGEIVIGLDERGGPQSVMLRGYPFLDDAGAPLSKTRGDSEGLASHGGVIAVSFERDHRIEYYHPDTQSRAAGPRPQGLDPLDGNHGIEALAFLPDGRLLAGEESIHALGGWHPVWRFEGPDDRSGPAFEIAAAGGGFGLVGMDVTPAGNLVLLERFYLPGVGNRAAVSWLDGETAAEAEGRVQPVRLAIIEPPLTVDNFEGIAATGQPDGSTALWLISDDNFSNSQRTLLMGFTFDEAAIAQDAFGE